VKVVRHTTLRDNNGSMLDEVLVDLSRFVLLDDIQFTTLQDEHDYRH
jgi:hypothetical protein